LIYVNDNAFLPIGYVSIEELAEILGLFGYSMSVSDNGGRTSGYVNSRYYSIAPYAEEGKIVGPNGKVYGSFLVAAIQNKRYVKLEQFLKAIGLEDKARPAPKEEILPPDAKTDSAKKTVPDVFPMYFRTKFPL
jgi:hypothetical protein